MAYLLAWLGFNGRTIEDQLWASLVARTRQRAQLSSPDMQVEFKSTALQAFAVKVRRLEPEPLRIRADGRVLLCDTRFEPDESSIEQVGDEPAAVILLDPAQRTMRLLRDRLGQQPLLWVRLTDGVLAASKESILLGHPEVARDYDPEYLAAHFAYINSAPGRSMYKAIRAVEPGARTDIDSVRERLYRSNFEPDVDAYSLRDKPAASRFRELLEESVRRSCEGAGTLGIALSSGLDSSSVAALLPAGHRSAKTRAVAFGSAAHGGFDERGHAESLAVSLGIQFTSFDTAGYPPALSEFKLRSDPGYPFVNPCRALSAALYQSFGELGVDVYLTGNFADFWSPGPRDWLRDALMNRRWDVVMQGYRTAWSVSGIEGVWRDPGWRTLVKGLLRMQGFGAMVSHMRPEWQNFVVDSVEREARTFREWPHPERAAYNLGSFAATDAAYVGHYRDIFGVQSRHPYREWNLLRFCLSLPAYHGIRASTNKWIARAAVADVLPVDWSLRLKRGGVGPFYQHYYRSGGLDQMRAAIASSEHVWDAFVDGRLIRRHLEHAYATTEVDWVLLRLAGFGIWLQEQREESTVEQTAGGTNAVRSVTPC